MFQLYNMDAIEWLKTLSDSSVDLIITDPPYESIEKWRKIGTTTRLKKQWFTVFPNERFLELFSECFRVLKNNTHLYLFCDSETAFIVKPFGEEVGFKFWKPLVWEKDKNGMGYHYRARYEFILFFEKGKRKLNNLGLPDVLRHPRISGGFPTEKPIGLLTELIQQSSVEGELVCDAFMGSGSTGVAALTERRNFIGCDIDPNCPARARLESVV